MDIVVTSDGGKVFWFKNGGSQNFTKETIDGSLGGAEVVRVFDMDNDGDLDVIVAATSANTVWYESNASTLNVEVVYPQTAMLYPNPTARVLQLDYMADTNTEYGLFDITGKRLTTFNKTGKHHKLDVSSLSKGTYLLKATSGLQFAYYRFVKE